MLTMGNSVVDTFGETYKHSLHSINKVKMAYNIAFAPLAPQYGATPEASGQARFGISNSPQHNFATVVCDNL